jgi:LysM domain
MRSIEQAFGHGRLAMAQMTVQHPGSVRTRARLTRRGRVVVTLVVLVLLVVGFSVGRVSSQAAGPARPLPTVTVHPGETLWQVAARVAPHADPRPVVLQIEALNHLRTAAVVAGQQLVTPRTK